MSCERDIAHSGAGGVQPPTNTRAPKRPLELVSDDCRRVCTPDFERPFSSLYNAIDRLLPFHVGTPLSTASFAELKFHGGELELAYNFLAQELLHFVLCLL